MKLDEDKFCMLIYKKSSLPVNDVWDPEILYFPYYACFVHDDVASVNARDSEVKILCLDSVRLCKYQISASQNDVLVELSKIEMLQMGWLKNAHSFRILDGEEEVFEQIDVLYE